MEDFSGFNEHAMLCLDADDKVQVSPSK